VRIENFSDSIKKNCNPEREKILKRDLWKQKIKILFSTYFAIWKYAFIAPFKSFATIL